MIDLLATTSGTSLLPAAASCRLWVRKMPPGGLASIRYRHRRRLMMFQASKSHQILSLDAYTISNAISYSYNSWCQIHSADFFIPFSDRPIPTPPSIELSIPFPLSLPPNSSTPMCPSGFFPRLTSLSLSLFYLTFPSLPFTPTSLLVHALVDKKVFESHDMSVGG